uniref:Uncharacterized protein n=1 Tax=Amphiprion percula TaxID=161767 RepID=A0A3P8TST5_AMPPE
MKKHLNNIYFIYFFSVKFIFASLFTCFVCLFVYLFPAMTRLSVLVLVLVLVLVGSEARVQLNSIRTVVIQEDEVLPRNRSSWEPRVDLMLFQCMSDLECSEGSFCHASTRGPAHSRCQACRRRKRRCHRDSMCCPGNSCSNNICVPVIDSFTSQRIPDSDGGLMSSNKRWRKRGGAAVGGASGKGRVGDPCLRSSDCPDSSCCARHFWARICKPVLQEGQVCTRHRHKGTRGLELFQRCSCGDGLTCRTLFKLHIYLKSITVLVHQLLQANC